MRKLIILLLFATGFSYAQETVYHNPRIDLKNGEYYYLFGNDVKFRKLPNTNSEVIELLKIGTEIEIIDKSQETLVYNGIESPFYKVKFKNEIGYILGGLISIEKREINNSQYFFAFKKIQDNYSLIIRHLTKNSELKEIESELETHEFSVELYNNRGIEGIENVLFINYIAEACGIDGGGIYFFRTKNEIKKVFEIEEISDGGIYWFSETLIFPNDKKGVSGKIVYKKEAGVYEDEETNWIEITKTSRELKWENEKIVPKIK